MANERVFQREDWSGEVKELALWWTLAKGAQRATCRMLTHIFGHELRLEVKGELVASRVCRTETEILDTQEQWRTALEGKGWGRP